MLFRSCLYIPYGSTLHRNPASTASPGVNIDPVRQAHYIGCMKKQADNPGIEKELALLEQRVTSLVEIVERLIRENHSLRTQQESLTTERAGLIEKHNQVRSRVDAIVTRLKALETGA